MKKILIVTDSASHTGKDDIFHLVKEFKKQNNRVFILDRRVEKNKLFFMAHMQKSLWIHEVKESDFTYNIYKKNYNITKNIDNYNFNLVLLRIDRPINDEELNFINTFFHNSLIINSPLGIIETASKEFLFKVKEFCPPMKLCTTYNDIKEFSKQFPIVVKPLKGYGGKGICRILNKKYYFENEEIPEEQFEVYIKSLLKKETKVLAVKYLKNIYKGDKRIYVIDGMIIGATNRIPKDNSWIGNVQYGAKIEHTSVSIHEKKIINGINNILKKNGVYVYGVDILLDDNNKPTLSEINTLNVGGCRSIDELYNTGCIKTVVTSLLKLIQ